MPPILPKTVHRTVHTRTVHPQGGIWEAYGRYTYLHRVHREAYTGEGYPPRVHREAYTGVYLPREAREAHIGRYYPPREAREAYMGGITHPGRLGRSVLGVNVSNILPGP